VTTLLHPRAALDLDADLVLKDGEVEEPPALGMELVLAHEGDLEEAQVESCHLF